MGWWFKNNPDANWSAICAALLAIDEKVLAKDVAKNHGKTSFIPILNDFICTLFQIHTMIMLQVLFCVLYSFRDLHFDVVSLHV